MVADCLGMGFDSPVGLYHHGGDIHGRMYGGRMAAAIDSRTTEARARIPPSDPSRSLEFPTSAHRAGFCFRPLAAKAEAAFLDQGVLGRSGFCAQLSRRAVAVCQFSNVSGIAELDIRNRLFFL
jgi:hypothetical protein